MEGFGRFEQSSLSEAHILGYKIRQKTTAQRRALAIQKTRKEFFFFSICYRGKKPSRIFLGLVVRVDFGRTKLGNSVKAWQMKEKDSYSRKRSESNGMEKGKESSDSINLFFFFSS